MLVSPLIVNFDFAPSRQASGLLILGLLPIVASTFIIPIPASILPPPLALAVQATLASAIVYAFYRANHQLARLRAASSVHGLRWQANNEIAIINAKQQTIASGTLQSCFIAPALTTIRIRTEAGHNKYKIYTALILPDSLPADDFRQLRLRLKQLTIPEDEARET